MKVTIDQLTFPPENHAVLRQINFTVNRGDFIAVTGKAASGKSLLLHAITGAAVKFYNGSMEGNIRIFGEDTTEIPLPQICRSVGFMFQEPQNQITAVSVEDEVGFGPANLGCSREEIQKRTAEALRLVGLSGMEQRSTASLSGGQAQRLVLAGILALKTPILLLDQPGAELDPAGKRELYHHIRRLNREQGITVLMVPDNNVDIPSYANRILEVNNGTITERSPAALIKKDIFPKEPTIRPSEESVISLRNVTYLYKGGQVGCENIHAEIHRGDFISVIGKNGSGKTTLLKLIEGLLLPSRGDICVFGESMTKKGVAKVRRNIGFLFQNPDLQIFASSVKEEVAFALKGHGLSEEEKKQRIHSALSTVGLEHHKECHPQTLSRSQRQKLAFASALIHHPKLIIADEPTAGLGEEDSLVLMELLSDFCGRGGTVLLVTHDLPLAKAYSRRILQMDNHHLIGDYNRPDFADIHAETIMEGELIL